MNVPYPGFGHRSGEYVSAGLIIVLSLVLYISFRRSRLAVGRSDRGDGAPRALERHLAEKARCGDHVTDEVHPVSPVDGRPIPPRRSRRIQRAALVLDLRGRRHTSAGRQSG